MNPDVCVFCSATGCSDGTAIHGLDCPFTTSMWPIDQLDLDRGATCAACDAPFQAGDVSVEVQPAGHPLIEQVAASYGTDDVTIGVCVPCAALGVEVR